MTIWNSIARFVARPTIANWLIQRSLKTPYTHLPRTDDPSYMARYWVFNPYDRVTNKPKYWFCPWSIRVHHIKRDDYERDMHDHPWNARTIILKGHYFEKRLELATSLDLLRDEKILWDDKGEPCVETLHWRRPGDTAKLAFQQYHTVVDVSEGGVWTLFISGPWRGVWGFLVDAVKIPWKTYLNVPENGDLDDEPTDAQQWDLADMMSMSEDERAAEFKEAFAIEQRGFATGGLVSAANFPDGEVPAILTREQVRLRPSELPMWDGCDGLSKRQTNAVTVLVNGVAGERPEDLLAQRALAKFRLNSELPLLIGKVNMNREFGQMGAGNAYQQLADSLADVEFKTTDPRLHPNHQGIYAYTDLTVSAPVLVDYTLCEKCAYGCEECDPNNNLLWRQLAQTQRVERAMQQPFDKTSRFAQSEQNRKVVSLAKQDAGQKYSETEHFVADTALQMGFEIMDDDATIYACNLRQLVTLLRGYGVKLKGDEQ